MKIPVNKIVHLAPPKTCRYCKGKVEFKNNTVVYGKPYGVWPFIYLCSECGAKVGVHKGTNIPLGSLANRKLTLARQKAHRYFDKLWKTGKMKRSKAYRILARKFGIPLEECHIGQFEIERCREVSKITNDFLNLYSERQVNNG